MSKATYKTKEEVLAKAREAIGKTFYDIDTENRINQGKGALGQIVEESWFEYKANNVSGPDFQEAGVELKVTPYVMTRRGMRAKERLVCNIINYMEENLDSFYESSFWKKCETLLIMSYEHKQGIDKGNFTIDEAVLFNFPDDDLIIIKQDWQKIIKKIKDGRAHEISEGDTLYLGACTKGASSKDMRKQPFSIILAKQRAYSLKQSYMTIVLNQYIFGKQEIEKIITSPDLLINQDFENYVIEKIKPYIGKSQKDLLEEFEIKTTAKNVNELIVSRILGLKGRISNSEEFKKANISIKTIRVNSNGSIKENMSFPIFNFKEIVQQSWEDSEFKSMLEQTKFLFVIFQFDENNILYLKDILFWNIPEEDLEEVKTVWEETVRILKEGVIFTKAGNRTKNNLPKASQNRVSHVRPHGRDSSDTLELPDGRPMTKQCFWLNNTYIREQLERFWSQK